MMIHEEDDTELNPDSVDALLDDVADEEDEEAEEVADTVDEFGADTEEGLKSREWE